MSISAPTPSAEPKGRESRTPMSSRVTIGLGLAAFGVVFLLGALEVVDEPSRIVTDWWPSVIVVLGALLAIEQRRLGAGPLIVLVVGLVLLVITTAPVPLEARFVWPVVLILIGVWFLLRPGVFRRSRAEARGPRIEATAVFEDQDLRSSGRFERASLTTVFGDLDLDLRNADPEEGMSIDVTLVFGDMDIFLPADWHVVMSVSSVLGEVEHHSPRKPPAGNAPRLQVRGLCLFGDLDVRQ